MQNTSALYNSILSAGDYWYEVKLDIDGVGSFDETKLFAISTSVQMFHGSPTIGSAVAGEITVKMVYPTTVTIPTMAVLRPYVRVNGRVRVPSDVSVVNDIIVFQNGAAITNDILALDTSIAQILPNDNLAFVTDQYEDASSEWLPQGVFFVDTRERTVSDTGEDVLELHGYDAMLKAEQDFVSETITGDSTDTDMVDEIASIMGVTVDPRTYTVMTAAYTIPLPTGYSCREVLGYIAAMYVGCFIMTDEGKLRLVSILELPPETSLLITEDGDPIQFGTDFILV